MTRIGRQIIDIPQDVEVNIDGDVVKCKGPKGSLSLNIDSRVKVNIDENKIQVEIDKKNIKDKEVVSIWGTIRALLNNMIKGVKDGFEKKLEINGVGYNAQVSGKKLTLNLGFSHPVEMDVPENMEINVDKNIITISGIDKQAVGQFAALIREHRKPEPYKGKGIRYIDEHVRKKAGKKAVSAEGAAE